MDVKKTRKKIIRLTKIDNLYKKKKIKRIILFKLQVEELQVKELPINKEFILLHLLENKKMNLKMNLINN